MSGKAALASIVAFCAIWALYLLLVALAPTWLHALTWAAIALSFVAGICASAYLDTRRKD